jgi:hypothetical protein
MAVRERVTEPDIETEVVADLPNKTDQSGYCFRFAKLVFVKELCDWPDRPIYWSLDDAAKKHIGVMVAGERGLSIQVDRPPVPPLRDDAREARAHA